MNSSPVMVNGTLYVSGTNFGLTPNLYVFELFGHEGEASEVSARRALNQRPPAED